MGHTEKADPMSSGSLERGSRSILAVVASARVVACLRLSTSIPAIACHIQRKDASHARRGRVSLSRQSRWGNPL